MFDRVIDNNLYTRKALASTRDTYRSYCDIQVSPLPNNMAKVSLIVKNEFLNDSRQITLEFWNYFLDSSCKHHLELA